MTLLILMIDFVQLNDLLTEKDTTLITQVEKKNIPLKKFQFIHPTLMFKSVCKSISESVCFSWRIAHNDCAKQNYIIINTVVMDAK